jgi:large subunit ribosomal protein L17
MGHSVIKHGFGRKGGARSALRKGLVCSLIEHGRITTTLTKAKETQRHAEKAITLGKKGDLGSRRLLISRLGSIGVAEKLISEISKRFAKRPGGYTRVIKAGLRPGDMAPMAILELVDYKLPTATEAEAVKGDKDLKARKRALARKNARSRKSERLTKAADRRANRG